MKMPPSGGGVALVSVANLGNRSAMTSVQRLRVHRNPTGLELVRETTLEQFAQIVNGQRSGDTQAHISPAYQAALARLHFEELRPAFAPLFSSREAGDTLWFCRDEAGGSGIALIRNGKALIYVRAIGDYGG